MRTKTDQALADPLQDAALLRRLLRAKDRMDAASHEAWPVSRLAEVSGVSAAYFARSFKRAFGLPPHRYLLTRRIEQAVSLLRDTELSITDIAFSTGWQSLGTFGRIFHDVTGLSPSAMRSETRATMPDIGRVPACVVKAAQRPDRAWQFWRSAAAWPAIQWRPQPRRSHERRYQCGGRVRRRSG